MNNSKKLTIPVVMFLIAVFLECPSLIQSRYFFEIGSRYILSVVALLLFIVFIRCITRSEAAEYFASSVSILMLGNWSQPLLYFSCDIKTAEDAEQENTSLYAEMLADRIEIFAFIAIASVVSVWLAMAVIEKIYKKQWIPAVLCTIVCIGLSGITLLFSDKESNTSTVGGIQPAIVMMFLLLYCFASFLSKETNIAQKIIYIGCFTVMMAVLIYKHETGIPLICYAGCLLMYMLLFPVPDFRLFISLITVPAVAVSVLMAVVPGLFEDTLQKLTSRTDLANTDQTKLARQNLEYAGLFGSYTFDSPLSEASTDFSINTSIHFFGFFWAGIFLVVFLAGCYKKINELSGNSEYGLISNLKSLCFITFCIIIGYNLLVNLGIAPIIGVQAIFCGRSLSIAILSGLLYGAITYNNNFLSNLKE